jgi:hypothetical protein
MGLFLVVLHMYLHIVFYLKTCIFDPRYVLCTVMKISVRSRRMNNEKY